MKKLIILVAAAIAAVACSRTFDTAPAKEQAIGFGTWADQLTKARTAGASTFGAGDSFTGSFCAAILAGKPIHEAHKLAVEVSAYVCTQNGAMPTLPDCFKK